MIFTAQLYKRKVWRKSECMSVNMKFNLFKSLSFTSIKSLIGDLTDEQLAVASK